MPSIEERLEALERGVRELGDREAIRELTAHYCHAVVRADVDGLVALFTEDATLVTHFAGDAAPDDVTPTGTAQLREAYQGVGASALKPFVHNHVIDLDGDRARGVCSVEIRLTQDGVPFTGAGHYEDEYRRVDGEWKFQRRELFVYHWVPHAKGWV